MDISAWYTKRIVTIPLIVVNVIAMIIMIVASQNIFVNLAYAETGQGTDIFKVIPTIFGVENTKGDIIALVSVNNGESSRVKFLEKEAFKPVLSNLSSLSMTLNPTLIQGLWSMWQHFQILP
jgi:hypothetical protein